MVEPIPARLLELGTREFGKVWQMQLELVAARQRDEILDTLILVEHPDVITLGRAAKKENLLCPQGIPTFEIERGGDVTYHGPGQLVGYPIFQLRESERDLHRYLRSMEQALIDAVGEFGVAGTRRDGGTGVWAGDRKLASIGVAVKRGWVTLHGFALNVSTDLSRFAAINPCGLDAAVMTSLSQCVGREVSLAEARPVVARRFAEAFARRW